MANVEQLEKNLKNLAAKIAGLETKLREVDDVKEIEKLQWIYGYYLDNRLMQEVVDLFSERASVWSVDDIAAELGYTRATAYRYVGELHDAGLLTRCQHLPGNCRGVFRDRQRLERGQERRVPLDIALELTAIFQDNPAGLPPQVGAGLYV